MHIPPTQQQDNALDCGLFAIAHMTEFLHTKQIQPNIRFDTSRMRDHLITCFENKYLTTFSKLDKREIKRKFGTRKLEITLYKCCYKPDVVADMIACRICKNWYHKPCIQTPGTSIMNVEIDMFVCAFCLERKY